MPQREIYVLYEMGSSKPVAVLPGRAALTLPGYVIAIGQGVVNIEVMAHADKSISLPFHSLEELLEIITTQLSLLELADPQLGKHED